MLNSNVNEFRQFTPYFIAGSEIEELFQLIVFKGLFPAAGAAPAVRVDSPFFLCKFFRLDVNAKVVSTIVGTSKEFFA